MRKRLALLWTLAVLGAALALPATTAAGTGGYWQWKVLANHCNPGYDPYIKVKITEFGWTGTNYLTIDSWVQRKPLGSGRWQTIYNFSQQSYGPFSDGMGSHWLRGWRTYDGDGSYWYRIRTQVSAWYYDHLLYTKVLTSVKC